MEKSMNFKLRAPLCVILALCVLPLFAVGCNGGSKKGKIWITHYPDWYTPDLKTVAILPFGDRSGTGAGMRIGDKVSAELTRNTTYEVYTRANLRDVLAEKDLIDAGIIQADKAMEISDQQDDDLKLDRF